MTKPAFFVWTLAAPILTGALIVPLLLMRSAQPHLGKWIIAAAVVSCLVSVPFSIKVGKAMQG